MAIPAPVIVLPTGGADYTTDIARQTLSGTTSQNAQRILVNGSSVGVSYTAGDPTWAWNGVLNLGVNVLHIIAVEQNTGDQSPVATITITLVEADDFITVSAPTGIKTRSYQDKIEIVCSKNTETQVVGYNFYVYTQSGGINNEYAKINTTLVTDYTFYEDQVRELGRSVDQSGEIRITTITEEVKRVYYYSDFLTQGRFNEMVAEGSLPSVPFVDDTPFFFVITAVIYDTINGKVSESTYSPELEGHTLTITTGIKDLTKRAQTDIILTYSREMLTSDTGIDTKPGTIFRDIIDPISEEQARVYVVQDFMARSLSVSTLLDFDDANGDGVSDSVESSIPKRALQVALNLTDPNDVQTLIDEQFDKLAANVNISRKTATRAVGSVIFYIEEAPIRDMIVYEGGIVSTLGDLDEGIPAQSYQILATKILEYANKEAYYNQITKRYELELDVQAVDAGENGNTDSYTIKTVESGADPSFLAENPNPISFGTDLESNKDLATRIMLAFFIDTGTEGGYARTSIGVTGVHNVRVEKAGDDLMRRDWDPVRMEHIGGKVDVYIQGTRTEQISDQIAFSYESIQVPQGTQLDETFTVISAVSFQFKTQNPRVTAHTPIFEVTKVRNATRGADYDLTGYQIIGEGTTVDLDEALPANAAIGLATSDVIRVDYKFRSSDTFILSRQPVVEIISVMGQLSGPLTSDNWELVKLQDPLEEGNSTIAKDGLRIKFANNLPLTDFQTITDEEHVIILGTDEALNYLGVDANTIVITNKAKTVTYVESVDYSVDPGTSTTKTTIRMIESGSMTSGETILVSYTAIENFTVVYTTNGLLQTVQTEIDKTKHACADAIVKQAIENDVDFIMTIVPKEGVSNLSQITSKVQTAVANYVGQLGIGISLTQSDVVAIVNGIDDVDYVVLPFMKMTKADGSLIVRDNIGQTQFQIYNQGLSTAYITVASVLTYKTTDKGGPENMFRGVFENNMPLVLQDDPVDVSGGPGRAYIMADGKIVVSTRDGALPDIKKYAAAYYVRGETGSKDINVASVEYLNVGTFSITYDQPRALSRQSF